MRIFFKTALAAIMIVLSCGLSVLATGNSIPASDISDVVTVQINYVPESSTYIITGCFEKEKRGNIAVGLRIFDENEEIVGASVTKAQRDNTGKVVFEFEPVVFFNDADSGMYSFEISSFLGGKVLTYEYLNVSDGLRLLLKLDSLSDDAYAQTIINEGSGTGADVEIFKNLSPDSQSTAVSKLSAIKSGLTEDTANDPDCDIKVRTAIGNFLKNYNYYTAIGVFNDCEVSADVGNWIKKYADMYGFKTDEPQTSYSESDLWKYYENTAVYSKAHDKLKNIDKAQTIEEIKSEVVEAILCSQLDVSHVSAVDQFLSDYATAFSIELSSYNSLKNKSTVRSGIINTGLYTYGQVKERFDELVRKALSAQNNGSGSGGGSASGGGSGSGSGSGGGGSAATVTGFEQKDASSQTLIQNPFNDLADAQWAEEYILKLCDKGIVSGKDNNIFAPNDKITRAEIVKIIVKAFGLEVKDGKTFADVSDDDWYAIYVSAAADNGVIAGDDKGNFNPDILVTRQDIAVMLYRVMNITASAEKIVFTDFEDVADYAKPAVGYFSAIKVINGYPDGSFKPSGDATRAEAAKIIASVIE